MILERLRNWLPLLPLLGLLAGAYWLNAQVHPQAPAADPDKRHDPDYIVEGFSAVAYDEHGRPRHTLSAPKLIHYPDDDTLHIERPHLTSLNPDHATITCQAQNGIATHKGEEVILQGDVRLVRTADAQNSERVLTTTYLHILPDEGLADTDRPVTLSDARNVINAVGMKLDNHAQTLQLLSQVRMHHEINP